MRVFKVTEQGPTLVSDRKKELSVVRVVQVGVGGCSVCPRRSQMVSRREPGRVFGKSTPSRGSSRGKTVRWEGV